MHPNQQDEGDQSMSTLSMEEATRLATAAVAAASTQIATSTTAAAATTIRTQPSPPASPMSPQQKRMLNMAKGRRSASPTSARGRKSPTPHPSSPRTMGPRQPRQSLEATTLMKGVTHREPSTVQPQRTTRQNNAARSFNPLDVGLTPGAQRSTPVRLRPAPYDIPANVETTATRTLNQAAAPLDRGTSQFPPPSSLARPVLSENANAQIGTPTHQEAQGPTMDIQQSLLSTSTIDSIDTMGTGRQAQAPIGTPAEARRNTAIVSAPVTDNTATSVEQNRVNSSPNGHQLGLLIPALAMEVETHLNHTDAPTEVRFQPVMQSGGTRELDPVTEEHEMEEATSLPVPEPGPLRVTPLMRLGSTLRGQAPEVLTARNRIEEAVTLPSLLDDIDEDLISQVTEQPTQATAPSPMTQRRRQKWVPISALTISEEDVPSIKRNFGEPLAMFAVRFRMSPFPTKPEQADEAVEHLLQHLATQGFPVQQLLDWTLHHTSKTFDLICRNADTSRRLAKEVHVLALLVQPLRQTITYIWTRNGRRHAPEVYAFQLTQIQDDNAVMDTLPDRALQAFAVVYARSVRAEHIEGVWRHHRDPVGQAGVEDTNTMPLNAFTICAKIPMDLRRMMPGFLNVLWEQRKVTFQVSFPDRAEFCPLHRDMTVHVPGAVCELRTCFRCRETGHESRDCPRRFANQRGRPIFGGWHGNRST